ncbi:hypothetical protein [Corynebacterium efficiens YS-314]|uniref:Uncharacterized protein n=1 Tax=Corynebacterium efficiens (strain DSM 44549 / YS-314 / AJ 12310 / JCM 11189 / NBRC 100395) TaxID=196164 RepID=Q8FQP9_COREF|nr:hypothetical protein [Corynebacterium efficiens YS-314]
MRSDRMPTSWRCSSRTGSGTVSMISAPVTWGPTTSATDHGAHQPHRQATQGPNRKKGQGTEVPCPSSWWLNACLELLLAVGVGHRENVQTLVQLLLGQLLTVDKAHVDDGLADGLALCQRSLGDLRGGFVADCGVQRSDNGRGGLGQLLHVLLVGNNAVNQAGGEHARGVGQQAGGLKDVAGHHGDEHVELELALAAGEGDSGVVADDLGGDLGGGLAQDGVDLARHDGGTRLQVGQLDLAEAGQRAGAHEADVVGDLVEGDGDNAHRAGELDEGVAVGLCLEVVGCLLQLGDAGELDELGDNLATEVGGGVDAGADGGTTDGQLTQTWQGGLDALDAELDLACVAAELLAQGDRDGVHEVGAAGLDHGIPLVGLLGQGLVQHLQARDQVIDGCLGGGDVGRGGEGVIGGLAHVDIVVRVDLGAVGLRDGGDDLVGVHVGGGAGTGLEDVDRELGIMLAGGDLLAGGDDGVGLGGIQGTGVLVHLRAGCLQQAHRADLCGFQTTARDGEVLHGTLGLCTPQSLCGDLHFTHGVVFNTEFLLGHEITHF